MAIVALMGKRVIEKGKTWTKKETSLADYAYTYLVFSCWKRKTMLRKCQISNI